MAVFRTLYSSLGTFDKMLCRTCLFSGKIKGSSRFELSRMVQRVPKDQIMLRKVRFRLRVFVFMSAVYNVMPQSSYSFGHYLVWFTNFTHGFDLILECIIFLYFAFI